MLGARERDSQIVSFRLGGALLESLSTNAADLHMSRGEYARTLVVATLQDETRLEELVEIRELRSDVTLLRDELARALEAVLANVTGAEEQEIKTYVSKLMRRPPC